VISARTLIARLVRHPSDAVALVRAGWRLRARYWWRHAPFLPLPAKDYWHFRTTTALGTSSSELSVDEVVRTAKWSLLQRTGR
jgi:hypothetical protein